MRFCLGFWVYDIHITDYGLKGKQFMGLSLGLWFGGQHIQFMASRRRIQGLLVKCFVYSIQGLRVWVKGLGSRV
jgi:hypothetical protein